jgi:hypothetical protein
MTTYVDPATALRIARAARDGEIRFAEQARLARAARSAKSGSDDIPARPRRRLRIRRTFSRPAIAH